MTVTLADVADRAGVSAATVSRVLNGNYPVATRTRARVLRAVQELDYVVNAHARSLAGSTSDVVGVLVNDVADPFFGLLAGAVQSQVSGLDLLTIIANTGGTPEEELRYLELLMRQRARAVVITGGQSGGPEHVERLSALIRRAHGAGMQVVFCGRPLLPDTPAVAVDVDNRRGAETLTRHLTAFGHRHIAYLTGPPANTTTDARLAGHLDAMRAAGLAPGPVVAGSFGRDAGLQLAPALLQRSAPPTAIIAANDQAASGVLAAARELGIAVPAALSVAGFDDLPVSGDTVPALTTVRVPFEELGRRAGRIAMGADAAQPGSTITVRTELIVRDSVHHPADTR
ncbi:LacI family DNA-binding transcriptional regulator [Pseudonocardia sp. GCM10023141]|uniref:LacI family DNA-binding transcriptional regulator n=1 Tax=Pseudonocardia sp. GCM10023141 TaxID=3252653 RepID=UPI0036215E6A